MEERLRELELQLQSVVERLTRVEQRLQPEPVATVAPVATSGGPRPAGWSIPFWSWSA